MDSAHSKGPYRDLEPSGDPSGGGMNHTREVSSTDDLTGSPIGAATSITRISTTETINYKVYKRRFFGLVELALLNIVVSWQWLTFAALSNTSAQYFNTSESTINWVATAFLLAFAVAAPFTFIALHRYGPKVAIVVAAALILVGSWIKYAGTKTNNFGAMMFGQMLLGLAQPFVLSAPTSYSNTWFSPAGRTTATAITSLANAFGAALSQLICPFWASVPSDIPNMVLYTCIICTAVSVPAFFIPAKPPTPPSAGVAMEDMSASSMLKDIRKLAGSLEFYLIFIPFSIYVGFFNAFSSLINQIFEPYGFSETDAGIAGAILIVVGLVSAAIISPLVDKYKFYLVFLRCAIPILGICYLIFIWVPPTRSIAFTYVICAIDGAVSLSAVPVVLEFLAEIHYPVGPQLSSTVCWVGGQVLGAVFIIIMTALKAGDNDNPPLNLERSLIFEGVIAMLAAPLIVVIGLFGRRGYVRMRRLEADRGVLQQGLEEDERNLGPHRL